MRLIDADRLKELLDERYRTLSRFGNNEYEQARKDEAEYLDIVLDEQPTVDTDFDSGKWVPCSERLPEDGQTVLITLKDVNGVGVTTRTYWEALNKSIWQGNDVVAWMPLPKPYEVEL